MNTSGTTSWRTLRRTADLPEVPWANGRGTTVELISPDESSLFYSRSFPVDGRWRLSVASLDEPGPYSRLPDKDRVHVPLAGIGLTVDGELHTIPAYTPFTFDGGARTELTVLPVPTRAVNLVVDRDSPAAGRLDIRVVDAGTPVPNALAAVALDGSDDLLVPYVPDVGEVRISAADTRLVAVVWKPWASSGTEK
ncbi:MAG: HutD family protein [Corynebacterium provencense]|uniref:HutD family protein n=1 Tax=Corynebacterium provencense TaxID=1737425 RepID=UPI00298A0219|nr:HutD family protein [Corynebacterium provencense]